MVLSLVGTGFAAAPQVVTKVFSDTEGKDCEEAMAMLGGLKIYQGDTGIGGPARPDDPITRAEVAAVVTRMLGKEKTAKAMENYAPPFVDSAKIPSWAWGYVSVASSLGIVKGYPDGSFGPNNNVTHAEMLAMLVRALGHDSLVKGVWPTNYIVYGHSLGLTDGVDVFANLPATRGEVAIMVANALEADVYDEVAGEIKVGKSLLTGELRSGFKSYEGAVSKVDADKAEISGTWKDTSTKTFSLASQVVLSGVSSLDDLVNLNVKVVLISDKVVYVEVVEEADVVEGVFDKVDGDKIVLKDGTKVEYDSETKVFINGDEGFSVTDLTTVKSGAKGDVTVKIVKGDDGVAAIVRAETFDVFDTYLTDDPDIAEDEDEDSTITVNDAVYNKIVVDDDTIITIDGEGAELEDLKADMVVYVATRGANDILKKSPESSAFKVTAYSETKEGKIYSKSKYTTTGGAYWKIKLEVGDDQYETVRMSTNVKDSDIPALGSTVEIVLNADGYGRRVIEVKPSTTYVKLLGTVVEGVYTVVVDRQGEEVEYESEKAIVGTDVGKIGKVDVVGGKVKDWLALCGPETTGMQEGTVVSVSGGTVVIKGDDNKYYASDTDVVVYKETSDKKIGDYIGIDGLKKDNKVYFYALSDTQMVVCVVLKY